MFKLFSRFTIGIQLILDILEIIILSVTEFAFTCPAICHSRRIPSLRLDLPFLVLLRTYESLSVMNIFSCKCSLTTAHPSIMFP